MRRFRSWLVCFKRPWNARAAYFAAIMAIHVGGEYRCPCGRCELPVFGSTTPRPLRTNPSQMVRRA